MTVTPPDAELSGVDEFTFRRPQMIVFDINETLSDTTAMSDRFADVGASSTCSHRGLPASYATASPSQRQALHAHSLTSDPDS